MWKWEEYSRITKELAFKEVATPEILVGRQKLNLGGSKMDPELGLESCVCSFIGTPVSL